MKATEETKRAESWCTPQKHQSILCLIQWTDNRWKSNFGEVLFNSQWGNPNGPEIVDVRSGGACDHGRPQTLKKRVRIVMFQCI